MHIPLTEFGPWTTARFHDQVARDQFLCVVATFQTSEVESERLPGDARGALVRWRPGQFLGLNDVAYAHGGRIVFTVTGRRSA